jgi:glycosyltransferase involved in cell wall biosynthesis
VAQGLQLLIDLANATSHLDVEYYFVGDGSEKVNLIHLAQQRQLANVYFLDSVKATEVPQYLAQCDLAYLSLIDAPIYELTVPAKLQSYLACGIPVLASVKGEVARILETSQAGFVSPPGDAIALQAAIQRFMNLDSHEIRQLRSNARSAYERMFEKEMLLNQMDVHLMGEQQ